MQVELRKEIERLTRNAAAKREGLLQTGLKKSRRRKALTVTAGILALTSAGTFTAVASRVFSSIGVELLAALVAGVSGTCSLLIAIYYGDDEVLSMLTGSAKYLALRENVYRLVIHPSISDHDRFERLTELQDEYSRLDELYSKYFSMLEGPSSGPPVEFADRRITWRAEEAARNEMANLHREMQRTVQDESG